MLSKIRGFIQQNHLLSPDSLHLVALSGGADSVALLCVLQELGFRVEAAHCNFHLRGEESCRDSAFVQRLCIERGVPLHLAHFETLDYANLHHVSVELAARSLRYSYFRQLCRDLDAETVCVAHHRDDNVETVLMNIVRGTGLRGLCGIRPKNGIVVRPLLCVCRQEILDYLSSRQQSYVTDSTNLGDEAMRNRYRHHVVPLLRQLNPGVCEHIQSMSERMSSVAELYSAAIAAARERVLSQCDGHWIVSLENLRREVAWPTVLYELLKGYGFSPSQVSLIGKAAPGQSGRIFHAGSYDLLIDRGRLIIERCTNPIVPVCLPECGCYVLSDGRRIRIATKQRTADFIIPREKFTVCMDAEKVRFPLTLRVAAEGDRFVPFGMRGSKLVSDFLTDIKQNLLEKRRQLILCDADGTVIWVVGQRLDNRVRVEKSTVTLLQISLQH